MSSSDLVEGIFPIKQLHMFGGSVHSGKTLFVLQQFIDRWQKELPVFGHKSHKAPFCYVACAEPLSALRNTIQRSGLDPLNTFPAISVADMEKPETAKSKERLTVYFDHALTLARKETPDLEVIFLNGIQRLCPVNLNDFNCVCDFTEAITRRLQAEGITAFGIAGSAKVKGDDRFSSPCERILGSAGWESGKRAISIFERDVPGNVLDLRRTATIMPSSSPDQILRYTIDIETGLLTPNYGERTPSEQFTDLILAHPDDKEFTWADFRQLALAFGKQAPEQRTMEDRIRKLVKDGVLRKGKWGRYTIATEGNC